jgi:hypothetical protein
VRLPAPRATPVSGDQDDIGWLILIVIVAAIVIVLALL